MTGPTCFIIVDILINFITNSSGKYCNRLMHCFKYDVFLYESGGGCVPERMWFFSPASPFIRLGNAQ